MYTNLSILDIIQDEARMRIANAATEALNLMESGQMEYDPETWLMMEQYLADCRTWAMRRAELLGITNQCSSAFGLE